MTYKLTTGWPQHIESGAFVNPETNSEYLVWLSEGNMPEPAEVIAVPVPSIPSVTPRQIRMALTRVGLRQQVEDAVNAGDQDLKDWWEFSTTFERSHEQVVSLAELLAVPSDQVDALWILAGTL